MRTEGLTFEAHEIGATFRTLGRTVSETDIVTFVNLCGFTEPLFMDMEYVARESVFTRRAAPGALTWALSEGLIMQTGLIHGTGMAFLGGEVRVVAPVLEGDTLTVEVEVADKRETKKLDRGIVTYRHRVQNQRAELLLHERLQPRLVPQHVQQAGQSDVGEADDLTRARRGVADRHRDLTRLQQRAARLRIRHVGVREHDHRRGQSVRNNLHSRRRILVRNHRSESPGVHSMARGEARIPSAHSVLKPAAPVAFLRSSYSRQRTL